MITTIAVLPLLLNPPNYAPPYEFDPVTAAVSLDDDDGTLEVLVFDADGQMDGAMLATPLDDHIRIEASFGDGHVSFELVLLDDDASIRNVVMDLDEHVAEHRMSTMLGFASTFGDGPEQPITRRGCMVRFGVISALCASAIAIPSLWAPAAVACTGGILNTYCQCLPLLGYDPCN